MNRVEQVTAQTVQDAASPAPATAIVTLFSIPKPFAGAAARIQERALDSWQRLGPRVQVVLCGETEGMAEAARSFGFALAGDLPTNAWGTPLVDRALQQVRAMAQGSILAYVNADIILLGDFLGAIDQLARFERSLWLAIGRRTDVAVPADFNPGDGNGSMFESAWRRLAANNGRRAAVVCKDYFIFPAGVWDHWPPFAVGRGNWDNWLVHDAKRRAYPVIDVSSAVLAIHQDHDYGHVEGGRGAAYVFGREAKENQRLAGGRHIVSGCAATWELSGRQFRRRRFPQWVFWRDLPRFARLLGRLH